jgi:L-alanine-DL-glutamate epimerase-like enolase superfamily enzyme
MSDNDDAYPERTDKILELADKKLAGKVTPMADANGSYNAKNAIDLGKRLQEIKYLWFEEPCPWEELSETKHVADALDMKVAFGEQDSSLWNFQYMIDNEVMDVVQPDLNYNGGFVRAVKSSSNGAQSEHVDLPAYYANWSRLGEHLAICGNYSQSGPFMEYVSRKQPKPESWYSPNFDIKSGVIHVPSGPGLRLEFDPDFVKRATVIQLT